MSIVGDRASASSFSDPAIVARYTEGPPRFVPGFADLHRMMNLLLTEKAPKGARVLALGAGGGLELKTLAEANPDWTFDGVDPSLEMLGLARKTLGSLASRTRLHHGIIDDAPEGPFDAATCLLTLHFVHHDERKRITSEIHRRLKPGAPLVVAHLSIPEAKTERAIWLERYAAFAVSSGVTPDQARTARAKIESDLHILAPEYDEAILRDAGFSNVSLFYVGFTFHGWVAYA